VWSLMISGRSGRLNQETPPSIDASTDFLPSESTCPPFPPVTIIASDAACDVVVCVVVVVVVAVVIVIVVVVVVVDVDVVAAFVDAVVVVADVEVVLDIIVVLEVDIDLVVIVVDIYVVDGVDVVGDGGENTLPPIKE